jgi:exodeoxyribonuclease VII large subunit
MFEHFESNSPAQPGRVWAVGSLVRAIADALAARFNPVAVQGEISGFSRAASGHCYFSLKDEAGQIRCAMFRRAADQLAFSPRDGMRVQVRGKLDVYGPRGDLQLIVESMAAAGQGALFEQFLKLKAQLEAEGLFDPARKRQLPAQPHRIGVVTSLGAAALRDVATALRRRVPHLPVVLYPASVQGLQAPAEIVAALEAAYRRAECDVLLLVRGGGSLEDLWSFNDPEVVRAITRAPMPVVVGVGHETDFTLADFAADLRAPTPTAAAEMCAPDRQRRLQELAYWAERLGGASWAMLDTRAQRLDRLAQRMGRPSGRLHLAQQDLTSLEHRLKGAVAQQAHKGQARLDVLARALPTSLRGALLRQQHRLQRAETALNMLDPQLVLERGFALVTDEAGRTVVRVEQVKPGDRVRVRVANGEFPGEVRAAEQSPH